MQIRACICQCDQTFRIVSPILLARTSRIFLELLIPFPLLRTPLGILCIKRPTLKVFYKLLLGHREKNEQKNKNTRNLLHACSGHAVRLKSSSERGASSFQFFLSLQSLRSMAAAVSAVADAAPVTDQCRLAFELHPEHHLHVAYRQQVTNAHALKEELAAGTLAAILLDASMVHAGLSLLSLPLSLSHLLHSSLQLFPYLSVLPT